ncbi:MAG: mechanosensitive ion channel domain-containing protein [Alphaproteobacteria bacterium]|jgi:small-conductance mechanosensitive channel
MEDANILLEKSQKWLEMAWKTIADHATDPTLYSQGAITVAALFIGWVLATYVISRIKIFREEPTTGSLLDMRKKIHSMQVLLLPIACAIALGFATPITKSLLGEAWLVRGAQGIAFVILAYNIANHFLSSVAMIRILKWIGVPIAILFMIGLLDDVVAHLDGVAIEVGNIRVTLYAIMRTLVFGIVLLWLARVSNVTGQRVIRNQGSLDSGTREVIAKLFEIAVFVVIFLLLLNVMGIDLTALAVFGGALGVGLGFGLQQIASNFISGIIILLDRTITIGDFIELEDGRTGTLRELTMRSATLETFDGKDIMVPNERFITTAFTNWTHNNQKQRYSLHLEVAYKTDLEPMFERIRDVCASHPSVLSGEQYPIEERPDAEIEGFADSGIKILVEFWMEGIDDGKNRVGGDLYLMIWMALKEMGVEIPFPQREVKVVGGEMPRAGD